MKWVEQVPIFSRRREVGIGLPGGGRGWDVVAGLERFLVWGFWLVCFFRTWHLLGQGINLMARTVQKGVLARIEEIMAAFKLHAFVGDRARCDI